MVLFNYSTKELTAKIVYYGPGLCGKTTNLQWVHEKIPMKNKGKMLSLATEADRTLFFDFLPIDLGTIRGMKTRVQLYTVPGQVFYNATRRMVLKGADCVVFVADSQEALVDANLGALDNLRENLEANEIDPDQIPTVIQYNKRDLPNALPIEVLQEKLNPKGWPYFEAVAMTGEGVQETLKGATAVVFRTLAGKYGAAPARPKPPPPKPPPAPMVVPEPAVPDLAPPPLDLGPAPPEPLDLDLDVPAPMLEPATPAAGSLLDDLESAPEPSLDFGDTNGPAIPIAPEAAPVDEPELPAEAEPELDLEPEPLEAELDLDVGSVELEPELDLDVGSAELEPELDLDVTPAEPELTLDPDDPFATESAPAAPELDFDVTEPPGPELPAQETEAGPTSTLPPDAAPTASAAGVLSLDVPVSLEGGEVVVPIRMNIADGTTQVQIQLRLTLRLQLEK